jgi:hypothetical protein
MGNVTSHSLPGFCLAAISKACSMLSACIATLKRVVPLLTWTEILIISPHLFLREIMMFITYQLYFTILTDSSETMSEQENYGDVARG